MNPDSLADAGMAVGTVVVFAPVAGDAAVLGALLESDGVHALQCPDADAFYAALDEHAACAIVTEEGLARCSLDGLDASLRRQPPWSDLPLLALAGQGQVQVDRERFTRLARLGNVTLIERPTSREVLLMSLRSAIRARRLQLARRDQWQALERHAAELEAAVQERTRSLQRETGERRRVEQALSEARQLETLGRLTGGVAHDFNNVLQVISGAETLMRRLLDDEAQARTGRLLDSIRRASDHGAALTQQLLAYARKQPLNNKALDLRAHLGASAEMLMAALGAEVRLVLRIAPTLWPVFVDPAQLDAAILNIVGNARDAMPGGGTVTLAARNVVLPDAALPELAQLAGEHVCICVTDDGEGMSEHTVSHAFEPFFTTKDTGKGTGLGLSQVYGFAIQSRGRAFIRREAVGTTIGMALPRSMDDARLAEPARPADHVHSLHGLHVLCVEDDPTVAETTSALLASLGASVTLAGSADAALGADFAHIGLVLSDVMMPGTLDGIGLAQWLAVHHPDLPVVLVSGYMLDPERLQTLRAEFLRKPFALPMLAEAIRRARERVPGKRGATPG